MQRLTKLILLLNRIIPPTYVHSNLAKAKRTVDDYQHWEYEEIEHIYRYFEPYWNLKGKIVLDIGCGLGGKLLFYVRDGAERVIGVDLRMFSTLASSKLAFERGGDKIKIALADGTALPFPDNAFDAVISVNVLEHVVNPALFLKECNRVLRPGGYVYLYFPPFYSPWGAHLDSWINFPWPHLLFSAQSLVKAAAIVEEQKRYNEQFILPARVPWSELQDLYELNRLTIHRFKKLIKRSGLRVILLRFLPFGHHALRQGFLREVLLCLLRALSQIPLLNEVIVTKIVCVLTKG